MPRNPGADIDTAARRVRDRDGVSHPLDRLVVADSALFYERPLRPAGQQERLPGQLFYHHQRWILPACGWVVNRMTFFPDVPQPLDWYIEPDIITVDGDIWHIRDAYLDVEVYDGIRYHVDDANELADGLRSGHISLEDAAAALEALHELCAALTRIGCSGEALLKEHAPSLPGPDEML